MTNNREIKFRGMLTKERVWFYGIYDPYRYRIGSYLRELQTEPFWHYVDPETVGQYTGLKDKNGKEIFEGDIVQSVGIPLSDCKSIVRYGVHKSDDMSNKYQCGNLGFYLEHILRSYKMGRKDIMFFIVNCEVIGNIYENPELLEVK